MSDFKDKKIILGVSGGIAAYKSAELLRLLVKQGAQVQVVMTQAATQFISALTFQALSGRLVRCELFDLQAEAGMGHIELARWADLILLAPATANTIAKITHGIADNLLTSLCLASKVPLLIAPAMNQHMWHHQATVQNIKQLNQRTQVIICGPASGQQACGDLGLGRMLEAEQLVQYCADNLSGTTNNSQQKSPLAGKRILITAGPTIEDIDPVRYVSNRSSGKMGYAIAQAAQHYGAQVILVSGPVAIKSPESMERISVRSAQQMHDAVFEQIDDIDIFIATAAVADYRPVTQAKDKIKKNNDRIVLEFIKNPDILADVSALKNKPLCIGFAAETGAVKQYALAKLERKNLDMVVANKVGAGKGFDVENNELHLYWGMDGTEYAYKHLPYASKKQLAMQLMDELILLLKNKKCKESKQL